MLVKRIEGVDLFARGKLWIAVQGEIEREENAHGYWSRGCKTFEEPAELINLAIHRACIALELVTALGVTYEDKLRSKAMQMTNDGPC